MRFEPYPARKRSAQPARALGPSYWLLCALATLAGCSAGLPDDSVSPQARALEIEDEELPPASDGCTDAPARELTVRELSAYQSLKIPLAFDGAAIEASDRVAPVVSARETVFRTFVAPSAAFAPRPISARLTVTNGSARTRYYDTKRVLQRSSDEEPASTFQHFIPGDQIGPNTRYALELVECEPDAPGEVEQPRFPADGDAALDARDAGGLSITVIPILANDRLPDTSEETLAGYRAYLEAMYPIDHASLTVGSPLEVDYPINWGDMLDALRARRQRDRPADDVYYYGLLRPTDSFEAYCGRGCTAGAGYVADLESPAQRIAAGLGFADEQSAFTMAHEVGHNHGRAHAPCAPGRIEGVDPDYPYRSAVTGVWGYDRRDQALFGPTDTADVMSYCAPWWISDYTYNALFDRIVALGLPRFVVADPNVIARYRVMLLDAAGPRWGLPFPEPQAPFGQPEQAEVLGADGTHLDRITVYRADFSHGVGTSVLVPEPHPDWHSVRVAGAAPIGFQ